MTDEQYNEYAKLREVCWNQKVDTGNTDTISKATPNSNLKNNINVFTTSFENIGIKYDRKITNHFELFLGANFTPDHKSLLGSNFTPDDTGSLGAHEYWLFLSAGVDHHVYSKSFFAFYLQYFMSERIKWIDYDPLPGHGPPDTTVVVWYKLKSKYYYYYGVGVSPHAQFTIGKYINFNIGFFLAYEIYYHKEYKFPEEPETTKGNIDMEPMIGLGFMF